MIINKFFKYTFYAIITSIVNISLYLLTYNISGNIVFSNFIAYTFSIMLQFIINKKRVFKNNGNNVIKQLLLFLLVKLIAFFIDSAVLVICVKNLKLDNFISKLISNISTTLSNYTLNDKIVFNNKVTSQSNGNS